MFSPRVYETILDSVSEGVLALGPEGAIWYANPAAVSMTCVPRGVLVGSHFTHLFPETERKRIQQRLDEIGGGRKSIYETCRMHQSSNELFLKILSTTEEEDRGAIVILQDVPSQMEVQEQMKEAETMDAIGRLAGGVAHDLNNILCGLVSYPELLLLQLPESSPLRRPLITIKKAGEKAAAIVQDLLILAQRGVFVTDVVNLNQVISAYIKSPEHHKFLLENPGIEMNIHLSPDLLQISGSWTHLSRSLSNLISNCAESMSGEGQISVFTENRYLEKPFWKMDPIREGEYVGLTVADSGSHIPAEDLERLFEPFYAKKKMGRDGTGLGMAVVWGTVKEHRGYIDVRSEKEGTAYMLYFPVTRKEYPLDKVPAVPSALVEHLGKSILIVDDVKEQRQIASEMLRYQGYSTHTVASGEEAILYLKSNKVDLVVLDMIMDPGMDGLDTYKKILEIHPGQKAIITSGYSETSRVREAQRLGAGGYVKKPFLLETLRFGVQKELDK